EGATVKVFYSPVCVLPPATPSPPNPIRFGLIHVAAGQSASIRAFQDPEQRGVQDPSIRTVQIRFLDAFGGLLASKMATLGPTGSVPCEFSGDGVAGSGPRSALSRRGPRSASSQPARSSTKIPPRRPSPGRPPEIERAATDSRYRWIF